MRGHDKTTYWVHVRDGLFWRSQEYCGSDEEKAGKSARKYVHLGPVRVIKQVETVILELPEKPVCT